LHLTQENTIIEEGSPFTMTWKEDPQWGQLICSSLMIYNVEILDNPSQRHYIILFFSCLTIQHKGDVRLRGHDKSNLFDSNL
jgi:hypothetical protein